MALGKVLAWGNLGVAITLKELKAYHIIHHSTKPGTSKSGVALRILGVAAKVG